MYTRQRIAYAPLLALGLLIAAAPSLAPAQGAARPGAKADATQQAANKLKLIKLMDAMCEASIRGDAEFFDGVLAADFQATTINGEVKDKAQILADYRAGNVRFRSHKFDDYDVRFFGDVAIVTNRATAVQVYKGEERTGVSRNTRVWVLRGDQWLCVSFQSTRVQKP